MVAHGRRHPVQRPRQASDLVARAVGGREVEIAALDALQRGLRQRQPVEHAPLEQPGHQPDRHRHHREQQRADRQEQAAVDDPVDVHQRDVVPVELVEIADADQHAVAVDADEVGRHVGALVVRLCEQVVEPRPAGLVVDHLVDGALGVLLLGQAVEVDLTGVAGGLDGAGAVDEQALDALLVRVHHLVDEGAEVEPSADDAELLAAGLDHAVDPHLGDGEHVVMVDVELAAAALERGEVPAVARIVGRQRVAELGARIGVGGVVEIVVARAVDDEEVGMVLERLAVVLQLCQAPRALGRVGLVARPFDDRRRAGDRLGQPHLARQRLQPARAVVEHLLLGEQRAEPQDGGVDHIGEGEPGGNRDRDEDRRRQREHTQAKAAGERCVDRLPCGREHAAPSSALGRIPFRRWSDGSGPGFTVR